ncbi:MAG: PQQ-dependent sugar dehydrogenase [Chloroflexi bacterium]|nr:PQQ-dependent sugar dehydrogenase [Chloroflexota bacterium]
MNKSAEAHLPNWRLAALKLGLLSLLVVLGATLISSCGGDEPEPPATTSAVATALPTQIPATAVPQPTAAVVPTAAPVPSVRTPMPPAEGAYGLETVGTGFKRPLYLTYAPGDAGGRLFIVEQNGTIAILKDGRRQEPLFLDIDSRVGSSANEQGLLSMAFDPEYAANGIFYVYYTDNRGDTVVARYRVSADNPDAADPDSEEVLLRVEQPYGNHNGGLIKFGPDGYLYVALGDGGSGGDPLDSGQDLGTLLGTLLRIDVRTGGGYAVPADNPFVGREGVRAEIWAWGLRNVWRFSFDRDTGDLFMADVGQNKLEEVSFQPAASPGGENYGWNRFEGSQPYGNRSTEGMVRREMVFPIAEYGRNEGCSVTGGYMYRGQQLPALAGNYIFGDYCSGIVWTLTPQADGAWLRTVLFVAPSEITSFGEDADGEVYVIIRNGTIYRITST